LEITSRNNVLSQRSIFRFLICFSRSSFKVAGGWMNGLTFRGKFFASDEGGEDDDDEEKKEQDEEEDGDFHNGDDADDAELLRLRIRISINRIRNDR